MKKIIYILYLPLTEKIEKDFYIKDLSISFIVEYWDISKLFFRNIEINGAINRDFIKKIKSYDEIIDLINNNKKEETLYIPQITYEWKVIKLFRILSKHHCKLAFYARGALPMPSTSFKILNLCKLNPKQIYNVWINKFKNSIAKLYRQAKLVKSYNYIFCSGENGLNTIGIGNSLDKLNSLIIQVNSFDYDDFMLIKDDKNKIVNERYCVFLDENLPYHIDFKMLNINTIEPEQYYQSLNTFFNYIENKYDIKVIIAAHPKSDYQVNPYDGRMIYKNKTNYLVKDCEFAMAHMSSSINYVILYEKPILFLITNDFKDIKLNYIHSITKHFCVTLNSILIDCDNPKQWITEQEKNNVNKQSYLDYKYKYLTSAESENNLSKDIVINFINNL